MNAYVHVYVNAALILGVVVAIFTLVVLAWALVLSLRGNGGR